MSETKHTPGPWTASCFLVTASNGREVTHTGLLGRRRSSHAEQSGGDEDEANAHLIAAAPDLLKALETYLAWEGAEVSPDRNHAACVAMLTAAESMARAAIAKAKGETP